MKILHYIPETDKSQRSISYEYVEALVRATSRVAESHVVTDHDLGNSSFISFHFALSRKLKEINPDIVHIHASWNFRASYVEHIARHKGFFTIVSPHGGLSPEIMELAFWKEKLPRIIAYQFKMIRKNRLIIAVSEKEYNDLSSLGWKRRTALISHPMLNNIGDEELCKQIMESYRKVIDTHYMERITSEEMEFVHLCLRAATWREGHYLEPLEESKVSDSISFRRIFLYAYDNNVTASLIQGAKVLGITMPPQLNVTELPRFKQKKKKQHAREKNFIKFCTTLHPIMPQLPENVDFTPNGEVSLSTINDIYTSIRFFDHDESKINETIKNAGLTKFTKKLMGELHDIYNLQTGFMLIMPF